MTKNEQHEARGRALVRWLFAAAFVFSVVLSGLFSETTNRAGLFYLALGSVAAALMGFSWPEIGAAFRHAFGSAAPRESLRRSAYFWEAAARNAWMLGVLGSALNLTVALGGDSGGIQDISDRMIQSFVVTLYGLVLAVLCLVPATKLAALVERGAGVPDPGPGPVRSGLFERVAGYVLFAAVLGLTVYLLVEGRPQIGRLSIVSVFLHGPALLVVLGGTIALALFLGAGVGARALTMGFGLTGLVGLLMGFIQALFGFVHTSVREISGAIAFIISVASFALLGLVAVAAPLEDREVMEGRRRGPGWLSRMSWVVFPLLAFLFLLLTFIMVIMPMKQPGG